MQLICKGLTKMTDFPTWAYALITTLITGACSTVVGLIVTYVVKRGFGKRKQMADKAKDQEEYEKRKQIKDIVTESLTPVVENIETINTKIDGIINENCKETKATVVTMRIKMDELCTTYTKRGWCNIHEKATWNELYNEYKNLGGNHFDEYVNSWKAAIEKLPDEKPHKNGSKKKKRLLENN